MAQAKLEKAEAATDVVDSPFAIDLGDLLPRVLNNPSYVERTILQDFDISGLKINPLTLNTNPSVW